MKINLRRAAKAGIESAFGVRIHRTRGQIRFRTPASARFPDLPTLRAWSPGDVIFDVGANKGQTVHDLRELLPDPTIYSFEPVASTFQVLVDQTRDLANVHPRQLALAAESGRGTMYVGDASVFNSLSQSGSVHTGSETVQVSTVDQVMEEEGVDFIHFLKVDAEGHDLDVLKGAERALAADRVAIIQVEVRFDRGSEDGLAPFRRYLEPLGYYFYGLHDLHRIGAAAPAGWTAEQSAGYQPSVLSYCDAVFVRAGV
jgi:FkbM family methyltransferase